MAEVRISPGAFHSLVELVEVTNGKGSKGQVTKSRVTRYRVYAQVQEKGLLEQESRANMQISRGLDITTYALPIDTLYEVGYKGRNYRITEIVPQGIYMIIKAYE